jgi:hypothetical protein
LNTIKSQEIKVRTKGGFITVNFLLFLLSLQRLLFVFVLFLVRNDFLRMSRFCSRGQHTFLDSSWREDTEKLTDRIDKKFSQLEILLHSSESSDYKEKHTLNLTSLSLFK